MGRNAQRRRLVRDRVRYARARAGAISAQLSQLAVEHDVPNRKTRRGAGNPAWHTKSFGEASKPIAGAVVGRNHEASSNAK